MLIWLTCNLDAKLRHQESLSRMKMILRLTQNSFVTVLLSIFIAGCRNPLSRSSAHSTPASNDQHESSIKLVSSSNGGPVTFTDSPQLQYGTGKMDADPATPFKMTYSGLRYRVLRGSRRRKPNVSDTVTVHYRGWLDNGKEFDSSYDRGEPTSFPLAGVVAGWTEGMQLVLSLIHI